MNLVYYYILFFLIYSILGWMLEVICMFFNLKKFVNRGFLIGPYCPIYGFCSIIMILYLSKYKDDIIAVFFLASIICAIIEYVISYLMEKIFKVRWWDYSHMKFNLNGRVCLSNTIGFGILGVIIVYLVNPFITKIILNFNINIVIIIDIIFIIIITIDLILSLLITSKLTKNINNIEKDITYNRNKKINSIIRNKFFEFRLIKAFPILKNKNIKN